MLCVLQWMMGGQILLEVSWGPVLDLAVVGRTYSHTALCFSQFLMQLMRCNGCNDQKSGDVQLYPLLVVGFFGPYVLNVLNWPDSPWPVGCTHTSPRLGAKCCSPPLKGGLPRGCLSNVLFNAGTNGKASTPQSGFQSMLRGTKTLTGT